ncbi:MAG: queuosine precursor transporter [bacterium]
MNDLIFILSMFFFLGSVLLTYKLFGKIGLFVFIAFATILANIQVLKTVEIFGFTTTAGCVMYASTFLCTDILSEKYGSKTAKKSVYLGLIVSILWLVGTQVTIWFNPSDVDWSSDLIEGIFSVVPRVTIASLVAYAISQSVDVFMYHKIWNKTDKLWLRNNGSTFVSQLVDSIIFFTIAFLGTMEISVLLSLIFTTYFFKIIVAFVDTPFIYLSKKIVPLDEVEENKENKEKLINE